MTSIDDLWSRISQGPSATGVFRLFDEAHPLDLFAGIDDEGRRVLMLVTDEPPENLPVIGVIEVKLTQRTDGRFSLILRLARPEFHELFGRLCQDLVDTSRMSDRQNGTARLLLRLNRWRKLLEAGPNQGLNDRQLRGLFGELWFLKTVAIPLFGHLTAIHGWNGPLGYPQDFQLGSGLVEIKTILPGAHSVSISSADQLDGDTAPLHLCVLVLDESRGTSLLSVVAELRDEFGSVPTLSTEFDLRLAEMGYADRPEYGQRHLTVQGVRYYLVTDAFPRIVTSRLPVGLSRVTYDVDLLQCGPYRSEYKDAIS